MSKDRLSCYLSCCERQEACPSLAVTGGQEKSGQTRPKLKEDLFGEWFQTQMGHSRVIRLRSTPYNLVDDYVHVQERETHELCVSMSRHFHPCGVVPNNYSEAP